MSDKKDKEKILPQSRLHKSGKFVLLSLLALLITFFMIYGFFEWKNLSTTLPFGDARLNMWIMSWNNHILVTDPLNYFNANIFHPYSCTLAFSEHLFVPSLIAWPFNFISGNPLIGYYFVIFFSFFCNFWFMYLLVREYGFSSPVSYLASVFFAFSISFVGEAYAHIQTLQFYWSLAAFLFFRKWMLSDRFRFLGAFFVCVLGQALSGWYLWSFFLLLFFIGILFPFFRAGVGITWRRLLKLGVVFFIAGIILIPFTAPYLNKALHTAPEKSSYASVSLTSWLKPPPGTFWADVFRLKYKWFLANYLFPGYSLLICAIAGFIIPRGKKSEKRGIKFYSIIIILLGVTASLGTVVKNPDGDTMIKLPYYYMVKFLIFLRPMRAVGRFGIIVFFAMALMGAFGINRTVRRFSTNKKWLFCLAISLIFLLETRINIKIASPNLGPNKVDGWLDSLPEPPVAAMLPDLTGQYLPLNVDYQAHSVYHWSRLINGDSRYMPGDYRKIVKIMNRFPDEESVNLLKKSHVDYVVVHPRRYLFKEINALEKLITLGDFRDNVSYLNAFVEEILENPEYVPEQWNKVYEKLEGHPDLQCLARFPSGLIYTFRTEKPPVDRKISRK